MTDFFEQVHAHLDSLKIPRIGSVEHTRETMQVLAATWKLAAEDLAQQRDELRTAISDALLAFNSQDTNAATRILHTALGPSPLPTGLKP